MADVTINIEDTLLSHCPEISDPALRTLSYMQSSQYLQGTQHNAPVAIDQSVRVPMAEGAQLHRLVRENGVRRSLEIGLAYGFSAIWILDALTQHHGASHVSLDPFQKTEWHGIGLNNIARANLPVQFDWIEDFPTATSRN